MCSYLNHHKKARSHFTMKAESVGASMEPMIKQGASLIVDTGGQPDLGLGDIAVVWQGKQLVAHRVIAVTNRSGKQWYFLKGDNNLKADGLFPHSEIVGKVNKIIYPSYCIDLTSSKHKLIKYVLVLYSRLSLHFPVLVRFGTVIKNPLTKKIYSIIVR